MLGSKCGSVRHRTELKLCASVEESLVAFDGGVSAARPPAVAWKPIMQSRASVEQKWGIKDFMSGDLHLCLFNDVAHEAAAIPQTRRLVFARAIEGAHF